MVGTEGIGSSGLGAHRLDDDDDELHEDELHDDDELYADDLDDDEGFRAANLHDELGNDVHDEDDDLDDELRADDDLDDDLDDEPDEELDEQLDEDDLEPVALSTRLPVIPPPLPPAAAEPRQARPDAEVPVAPPRLITATGELEWGALRALWATIPEPEWTPERAERIFQRIMATLEQRRRRRRRVLVAAAATLPVGLLVASRVLR